MVANVHGLVGLVALLKALSFSNWVFNQQRRGKAYWLGRYHWGVCACSLICSVTIMFARSAIALTWCAICFRLDVLGEQDTSGSGVSGQGDVKRLNHK